MTNEIIKRINIAKKCINAEWSKHLSKMKYKYLNSLFFNVPKTSPRGIKFHFLKTVVSKATF